MNETKTRTPSAPWGEHALSLEETLAVELGPLTLRARLAPGEVRVAHATEPSRAPRSGAAADPGASATEAGWVRWPVPEGTDRIALSPAFPDRTLVVEPADSFRLLPGTRARIFVRVPLWARLQVAGHGLEEIPSVVLSDTWWGGLSEGELCYGLRTRARRRASADVFEPHLVICPLQLANEAPEELPVEKIALRVAHLSVFSDEGRLWADETRVRYRGADEGSEIVMSGEPPSEATGASRAAEPRRSPPPRGFRARSFARLRTLPGLAGL